MGGDSNGLWLMFNHICVRIINLSGVPGSQSVLSCPLKCAFSSQSLMTVNLNICLACVF